VVTKLKRNETNLPLVSLLAQLIIRNVKEQKEMRDPKAMPPMTMKHDKTAVSEAYRAILKHKQ
jgi:hypothetical protein